MSLTAKIDTAINAAILDVNKFAEVTFSATFQKAATNADYDTVTGKQLNTNPVVPTKILLPESSKAETDGESIKITALKGIMLRSWMPGVEVATDDILTINTGVYAGTYIVKLIETDSVAHYEFALVK